MDADALRNPLLFAINLLRDLAIPYALIGGVARNFWAPPRMTEDVDMTALVAPEERRLLLARVQAEGLSVLLDSPHHLRFNSPQGTKVCILIAEADFELETIRDAVEVETGVFVASREHLIVYKCIANRSDKPDAADVQAILASAAVAGEPVNIALIEEWVEEWDQALPGVRDAWEASYAPFRVE